MNFVYTVNWDFKKLFSFFKSPLQGKMNKKCKDFSVNVIKLEEIFKLISPMYFGPSQLLMEWITLFSYFMT